MTTGPDLEKAVTLQSEPQEDQQTDFTYPSVRPKGGWGGCLRRVRVLCTEGGDPARLARVERQRPRWLLPEPLRAPGNQPSAEDMGSCHPTRWVWAADQSVHPVRECDDMTLVRASCTLPPPSPRGPPQGHGCDCLCMKQINILPNLALGLATSLPTQLSALSLYAESGWVSQGLLPELHHPHRHGRCYGDPRFEDSRDSRTGTLAVCGGGK